MKLSIKYKCKNCGKLLSKKRKTGFCIKCKNKFFPYWLGKNRPNMIGNKFTGDRSGKNNYFYGKHFCNELHPNWKGKDVGYHALHTWIYRKMGNPNTCELCGKKESNNYKIHWANKSVKYKRFLNDWIRLCAKCHYHFDRKYNI